MSIFLRLMHLGVPWLVAALLFVSCSGASALTPAGRAVESADVPAATTVSKVPSIITRSVDPEVSQGNRQKHALIIAIGMYPSSLGYKELKGVYTDVRLMRSALQRQGFADENVGLLADRAATRQGILDKIAELEQTVAPGDIVVIHYSGHGDRLTDDDPDNPNDVELDGYDEVIVPFDAPAGRYVREQLSGVYGGEKHIRDDEIRVLTTSLRKKLGRDGHLLLVMDSCHSGSVSRGELVYRSGDEPIGKPATQATAPPKTTELVEMDPLEDDDMLASYVSLFAANYNQLAAEILHEGEAVGAMTLALSQSLGSLYEPIAYEALYQKVWMRMKDLPDVRQDPQMEGDRNATLFDGAFVDQEPYFVVESVEEDGTLRIAGGRLQGLTAGSRVSIFPFGTQSIAADAVPKTTGTILEATALVSWLETDDTVTDKLVGSWAFITQSAFEELQVSVTVPNEPEFQAIRVLLAAVPFVAVADTISGNAPYRLNLRKEDDTFILETPHLNQVLKTTVDEDPADRIVRAVTAYARNRYLRDLEIKDVTVQFEMQLVPARIVRSRRGASCDPSGVVYEKRGESVWKLKRGDGYVLDVTNRGTLPAYFTILSLLPDGQIDVLFPWEGESDIRLFPGETERIECLFVGEDAPEGIEELKLVATMSERPLDLRPIIYRTRDGRDSGALYPFEQVLENTFSTRSERVVGFAENAYTASVLIQVESE